MLEQQPLVLVANDDEAMRDALQFALQLENFEVRVHGSGSDLLIDRELRRACCLILNDRLPHMDGIQVMLYLRERQFFPPAILLTANATPGLRRQASAAGIRMVLEKPILDNALLESVLTIMHRHVSPGNGAAT
jgi:FixJ family two-component response regulator